MFCYDSEVGDILIIRGVLFITSTVHFPCLYLVNLCVFGLVTTAWRIFLMLTEILIFYLLLYILFCTIICKLCLATVYSLTFVASSV
jgi:hypothetical protein